MPEPPSIHVDEHAPRVFDGWEIQPRTRTLLVAGRKVDVGGRAFKVLWALARVAGEVVTKQEIMDRAWGPRIVAENNLTVQVSHLRKLLGAEAIVNVAGEGYRLASEERPAKTTPQPPALLPAPPLYGRDADLDAVAALLPRSRLVTIVGAGGVGKTTLARALVSRLEAPSDGVQWIDLAAMARGTALIPVVARALELDVSSAQEPGADLLRALAQREALVVLDNGEHLLEELGALLTPLLAAAPGLRWVATSQEPLRLSAEAVYRLEPLDVPAADAAPTELAASSALAMFLARARAAGANERWTPAQLAAAAELCRQLDGLPLALEIAAARVATMSLEGLRDQIGQRLRLRVGARDAPVRHHSLLQTYEWSYALLSPLEQRVFRWLAPFADGFVLAMARQLQPLLQCDAMPVDDWEIVDAIDALVAKSLLHRRPASSAGPRLRLLESARDFAWLQLDTRGETVRARDAHAEVMARWFDDAAAHLEHWRDAEWETRYCTEHRNVQAALAWTCTRAQPALLARLVAALGRLEHFAQTPSELVRMPVPHAQLQAAPVPLRADALYALAGAHDQDGRRDLGTELALQALADYEALRDVAGCYRTLERLIRLFHGRPGMQREITRMWQRLRAIDTRQVPLRSRLSFESSVSYLVGEGRSLERLRELETLTARAGFDALADICRVNITDVLMIEGAHEEVVRVAREMLARSRMSPRRRALIWHNMALSLTRLGRHDEALAAARASLHAMPARATDVLDLRALTAAQCGRPEEAALMTGRSAAIKRERDLLPETGEAAVIADTLALLGEALGPARLAALREAGGQMSTEAALAMALAG